MVEPRVEWQVPVSVLIYNYSTPLIDVTLQVVQKDTNEHDEYTVAITKGGCIVGHTE